MTSVMKEYYSDPKAVASAVHKFMNITVDEISNTKSVDHRLKVITAEIIVTEGLDKDMLGKMNYTDLIAMLEMSGDVKYEGEYNSHEICTSEVFNLFMYKHLLLIILEAANNAIPIRMFLELPLQAFFMYLESVLNKGVKEQSMVNGYAAVTREMQRLHNSGFFCPPGLGKEDISIKELLIKVRDKVTKAWEIVDMSINEYRQMMIDELLLAKRVLALTFMETFPERFTEFEEKYLS